MMKKIILLLILQLTVLMAVDFTMSKSGTLTKESSVPVTTPDVVTPPVTTVPSGQSVILPNSVDLIWEDMHGKPIGYPVATHGGYPQYQGSNIKNVATMDVPKFNQWTEVEEEGDTANPFPDSGGGCLKTINKATNTRVELGAYRGWWLDKNNVWHDMGSRYGIHGTIVPRSTSVYGGIRSCEQDYFKQIRAAHMSEMTPPSSLIRDEAGGFTSAKPNWYFRWHGFGVTTQPTTSTSVKAVFVQVYARLIVDDPSKPDDRHLARYLLHVASDHKTIDGLTTLTGDLGISRYKRVTNDWQPYNMMTYITREELDKNPPPFVSKP